MMGATKALGCLIFLLFSGYLLLQAERGRRFLVGEPDAAAGGAAPQEPAISADEDPVWKNLGINLLLIVGTFLCYDLVVTNVLVFSLATDGFFLRGPLRLLLCGMVGVLLAAGWHELPSLLQELQQNWRHW